MYLSGWGNPISDAKPAGFTPKARPLSIIQTERRFHMESNEDVRSGLLEQSQHLAKKPNLIEPLIQDLKYRGFVGEPRIPLLVWLSTFTGKNRKLGKASRPVSVLIKGNSGAGKSYSLQSGLAFVPPEEYVSLSGMSEKALVYEQDLDLRHKHLSIGEAAGLSNENGRVFLRQLISEGEIDYSTVMKDSTGQMQTVHLHVDGPTGVLMTTTANRIHHEDETRMLSVNVPENKEQMKAALMSLASGSGKPTDEIDYDAWHAFHRYVTSGDQDVVVPYLAGLVDYLPLHHDRIKRDFAQVIALLKACALVHQFSRGRDEQGRVIANRDDYELIHYLLDEPLSEGLAVTVSEPVRAIVEAVRTLGVDQEHNTTFGSDHRHPVSIADIAKHLGRDRSAVNRSVLKALEMEYLYDENPGKGRPAKLQLGEVELPSAAVLPHPDLLFGDQASEKPIAAE